MRHVQCTAAANYHRWWRHEFGLTSNHNVQWWADSGQVMTDEKVMEIDDKGIKYRMFSNNQRAEESLCVQFFHQGCHD